MKILMLVNWKVLSCKETPNDKQPPDYRVEGEPYWFYRYFHQKDDVVLRLSQCVDQLVAEGGGGDRRNDGIGILA